MNISQRNLLVDIPPLGNHSSLSLLCVDCGVVVSSTQLLEIHIATEHIHYFPYSCAICSFVRLATEYAVQTHFKERHPHDAPKAYVCANGDKARDLKGRLIDSASASHDALTKRQMRNNSLSGQYQMQSQSPAASMAMTGIARNGSSATKSERAAAISATEVHTEVFYERMGNSGNSYPDIATAPPKRGRPPKHQTQSTGTGGPPPKIQPQLPTTTHRRVERSQVLQADGAIASAEVEMLLAVTATNGFKKEIHDSGSSERPSRKNTDVSAALETIATLTSPSNETIYAQGADGTTPTMSADKKKKNKGEKRPSTKKKRRVSEGALISCLQCDKTMKNVSTNKIYHIWRMHMDEDRYQCNYCQDVGTFFLTPMRRHAEAHHANMPEPLFTCRTQALGDVYNQWALECFPDNAGSLSLVGNKRRHAAESDEGVDEARLANLLSEEMGDWETPLEDKDTAEKPLETDAQ